MKRKKRANGKANGQHEIDRQWRANREQIYSEQRGKWRAKKANGAGIEKKWRANGEQIEFKWRANREEMECI